MACERSHIGKWILKPPGWSQTISRYILRYTEGGAIPKLELTTRIFDLARSLRPEELVYHLSPWRVRMAPGLPAPHPPSQAAKLTPLAIADDGE